MEENLRAALSAYRMDSAAAKLLRHNENATYRVEHAGRAYALRIHIPRAGFTLDTLGVERHEKPMLEGEMAMLRALLDGGFAVQRPIENRDGAVVTSLPCGASATMLSWLEGEPISEITDEIARECGALAARLRLFFDSPHGRIAVERYRYDEGMIERLRALVQTGDAAGAFADGAADMRAALDAIERQMRMLRETTGAFGLIHADLTKENIIVTKDGLAPIDFCLSGYGFFAQDVAGMIAVFGETWRSAILGGYAAAGAPMDARAIDPFVALSVLLFICAQWKGFMHDTWFQEGLIRWRREIFRPLSDLYIP
ncbi:MAG: phosphotransferase enzyme family protein [Christensenellales bacterium]|jgi:Ser/Thr protein kinase RdoA (MazF antagonist)